MAPDDKKTFLEAAEDEQGGLFSDFVSFMKENAKWWLAPFLIVFLLLGVLLIFGSGALLPSATARALRAIASCKC